MFQSLNLPVLAHGQVIDLGTCPDMSIEGKRELSDMRMADKL